MRKKDFLLSKYFHLHFGCQQWRYVSNSENIFLDNYSLDDLARSIKCWKQRIVSMLKISRKSQLFYEHFLLIIFKSYLGSNMFTFLWRTSANLAICHTWEFCCFLCWHDVLNCLFEIQHFYLISWIIRGICLTQVLNIFDDVMKCLYH